MKKTLITAFIASTALSAYAAELPPKATLHYSGSYGIPATMVFTRTGNQYSVTADIKVPLYRIRFESGGAFDGSQFKPKFYRDTRNGKMYAEAVFSGGKVKYGKRGESKTEATSAPVLDLFTLSWQLAASDGKLPSHLKITNGKRLYSVGQLTKLGSSTMKINGENVTVNNYRVKRGDDTVLYSFAPKFNNAPVKISYTDDGKTYDLKLTKIVY